MALINIILLQIISIVFSTHILAVYHKNSSYKTPVIPITNNNHMQKITLYYYEDFNCKKNYNLTDIPECKKYSAASFTKTPERKYILRCRQKIELLRPYRIAEEWKMEEKKNGYILFRANSKVKATTRVHIKSITSFSAGKTLKNTVFQPVTGVFKRYTFNAERYTFKNLKTGRISQINATTNHPFYAVNKQAFIPISMISSKDTLLSDTGQHISLICHNKKTDCGLPFSRAKPVLVYNLESYKKHIYFAGSEHITVHNCSAPTPAAPAPDPVPIPAPAPAPVPVPAPNADSVLLYNLNEFHSIDSPTPQKEQLTISEANNILSSAGANANAQETIFFLSYGTGINDHVPISSKYEYISINDLHGFVQNIDPDAEYKHVCIMHCANLSDHFLYKGYAKRAKNYFERLANSLDKSVSYYTEGTLEYFSRRLPGDKIIKNSGLDSDRLITKVKNRQFFTTVHPQ